MARNIKGPSKTAPGEVLDIGTLDKVVGGVAVLSEKRKRDVNDKDLAVVDQGPDEATSPFDTHEKVEVLTSGSGPNAKLAGLTDALGAEIVRLTTGKTGADAINGMEGAIRSSAAQIASTMGVSASVAESLAWSSAYKLVFEGDKLARAGSGALEAMKSDVRAHVSDVCKGFSSEIAYVGDVSRQLTRASEAMAQSISKAASSEAVADITRRGQAGFEAGLAAAKSTPLGNSVMRALEDPKNVEAWRKVMTESAMIVGSPSWVTPVKFLLDQASSQAVARAVGLGDFPPGVKQTAAALSQTMENVSKAVSDLYNNGYIAGMTMGLDIKGVINIGKNCADFGKAVTSGDTAAMGRAAQALVTDAANDIKDGLTKFYVGGATKGYEYTKSITMGLLNGLGATPYAELALNETKKLVTDVGNMAKTGSVAAANALADFAKNDVAGAGLTAVNEISSLARSTGKAAETAVNTLGDLGKSGSTHAVAAVNALSDISKSGAAQAMSAVTALSDVAGSTKREVQGAATAAVGALVDLSKSTSTVGLQALRGLGSAAFMGGAAVGAIAVDRLSDVAKSTSRYAGDALGELASVGQIGQTYGRKAVDTLSDLAKSGGAFATDAVKALNGLVGYSNASKAVSALGDIAKSGIAQGALAVEGLKKAAGSVSDTGRVAANYLGDVGKSGLSYANTAVDALRSASQYSNAARETLQGLANSGLSYARSAWNDVEKAAAQIANRLNPATWWPF